MEILTEPQIAWLPALLQLMFFMLVLSTVAVLGWWLQIVVSDLIKRLKTGEQKWTTR